VNVVNLGSVIAISAGNQNSCAVLKARTVKCWGYSEDSELGPGSSGPDRCVRGDFENGCSTKPIAVKGLGGVAAVSTRSNSSCALLSNQKVKCWGFNDDGELGNGKTKSTSLPGGSAG
jgi:alpha-tubulin suppressor-like RCC1 family protein